ncbi:MAG: AI-2E family transporter [Pseudobdellovibrionaceae bacterium]
MTNGNTKGKERLSWMGQSVFWFSVLVIIGAFLYTFKTVLSPFVIGFIIAYLLNPLIRRLQNGKHSRRAAVIFILVTFFAILGGALAVAAPLLAREIDSFFQAAPQLLHEAWAQIRPLVMKVQHMAGVYTNGTLEETLKPVSAEVAKKSGGVVTGLFAGTAALMDAGLTIVISPIVAFFLMKDWPKITKWVEDMMPRDHESDLHKMLKQIDKKLAGFVRGQLTVCLILGVAYAIALTLAGLNYGFFIGLATGLLSIIPYVGSTLGLVTSLTVAWFQEGELSYVGIIAAIFFIGQFLEGNFLTPKLVGNSVGLHPLWVLFAVMAGGAVFGILGMLLAVPVAAIASVLLAFGIAKYKKSTLYKAEPEKAPAKTKKK